jgi:hypothetical protein
MVKESSASELKPIQGAKITGESRLAQRWRRQQMARDVLAMIEYRDDPPILVFGDTESAIGRARRAAGEMGYRVAAATPVADAPACLSRMPAAPVYVELDGPHADPELPMLLSRLQVQAEQGWAGMVAAPAGMIDLIAAHAFHPAIAHLVDPPAAECRLMLGLMRAQPEERLHDVSREGDGLVQHALLHQLSEEIGRIAGILASLSDEGEAGEQRARPQGEEAGDALPLDAAPIRAIIRARRLRDQFFRGDLFADPAWDMLLDLTAARIEQSRVAVSSLCIAAAVPATTALRWIKALTDRGIFVRSADPRDGRRVFIELSDEAARSMAAYLRAAQRIAPAAI